MQGPLMTAEEPEGSCAGRLAALGLLQQGRGSRALQAELPPHTLARRKLYADMSEQLHLYGLPLGELTCTAAPGQHLPPASGHHRATSCSTSLLY